jgi:hypothetical protein
LNALPRCIAAALAAVAMTGAAQAADLRVVLPGDRPVAFRGALSLDAVGTGTGSFLYPAPNAAGLLVAVLTHSALVEQQKAAQKEKLQETADKVLDKYRAVLDQITNAKLAEAALGRLHWEGATTVGATATAAQGWVIEGTPVLTMTQDQRALFLDAEFKVTEPGAAAAAPVAVRVVSQALEPDGVTGQWMANDGSVLKEQAAALFMQALRIALDARRLGAMPDAYRTVRYPQGSSEQIERATLMVRSCDRLVIRNLRGTLMSVPAQDPQGCQPAAPAAQ